MPVDYGKVKKIFLDALAIPDDQKREGFISEACGTDIELRHFVDGMIEAHQHHATPIPQGPTKADPQVHAHGAALRPGEIVNGKYKVVELIAEGGMGSVYRACRIDDLKMEVAIKVIRPGMGSGEFLARFNVERQALALMRHENIARVLDAGITEQGLPYFVMELVKGLSLTKFCDESKLSVPDRLELFEKVCSAIQHAHQKGIVHRDLKPNNILVALYDDKPVPKVIDFGLAKALHQPLTDDVLMTRFGTFVGTWQYTAPEQAQLNNLDIDTRADIYSLGVILYELLTGTTPVDRTKMTKAAIKEVLRMICEEEPQKPSTKIHSSDQLPSIAALRHTEPVKLERMVRGELDWIVMKALEKDRNRRYATANELADDLERFRNHEPVLAGPPTFTYRASKYLRKHWSVVLVASLFVAAVTIGAIVSTYGWLEAVREKQRANVQSEIAVAVNDFLKELLSEADPAVQIKPDQAFVSNITVKKALDRAAGKVGARFEGKPLVEVAIRHTMGKTYLGLGDLKSAREQFEKAEQLRLKYSGENDPQRLESLYELGWVALLESKYPLSESNLKQVIEVREKSLGNTHADTLRAKYAFGLLLEYQDKVPEAKTLLESVLALQKQHLKANHRDILDTQRALAGILQRQGELQRADTLYSEVLQQQKEQLGSNHPQTLISMNNLAQLCYQKQEFNRAETLQTELTKISEVVLGHEHPNHLEYLINLAAIYGANSKLDAACLLYQKLIPTLKRVFGATTDNTLRATQNLAVLYMRQAQYTKAEPLLLEALDGCRASFGLKNEITRQVLENLISLFRISKNEVQLKLYQELLNQSKKE